ncbi:hypothetical protein UFOVP785_36 [uncultured Caudovirales phage]|uniref:Uncharacterized protein n=1 Tax=uncultured Caudovirales phage TaxID=2100421 RepID=A0A6J5NUD7_9CAUD|nr:hypothetical protein UFOVP785_36 [uncultured Caudovirales phage]
MAYSSATRSLRDGSLTISDGSVSAKTCTAPCMKGDLKWDITQNYVEDLCRGVPTSWRKGNKVPCKITFSAKMSQLIQKTAASADPISVYEILTNQGSFFTTTSSGSGGVYSLDLIFTIVSPAGTSDEIVTFEDCVFSKITCSEGDENEIQVEAMCLAEKPTVARD